MSRKKKQEPLLYIYQPFNRTPSNNMQDIYTIKPESKQVTDEKLPVDKIERKVSMMKKEAVQEQTPIEVSLSDKQQPTTQNDEIQRASFRKVKSFKEMDIKERLEYLLNFPKVLPPVPCVFYTEGKSYQGYLHEYQDDLVTIKFHDQTTETIPFHQLKDVIMIGIKK
jgi:hypothetical protein